MIEKTAKLLLNVTPIEELTDDISYVVENFRCKLIDEKQAMKLLLTDHKKQIQKICATNESLNSDIVLYSS